MVGWLIQQRWFLAAAFSAEILFPAAVQIMPGQDEKLVKIVPFSQYRVSE
jgi:hypothetical protein